MVFPFLSMSGPTVILFFKFCFLFLCFFVFVVETAFIDLLVLLVFEELIKIND